MTTKTRIRTKLWFIALGWLVTATILIAGHVLHTERKAGSGPAVTATEVAR